MRQFSDDDFHDAVHQVAEELFPAYIGNKQFEDDLEIATSEAFMIHGEAIETGAHSSTVTGDLQPIGQALDNTRLDVDDVVELIEREERFRSSGGRPSKVEYWAQKIRDPAVEEYQSREDVPRDVDEHEMAIASPNTYAKLGKELGD